MRNLKRALSLTLASVMLLGMMVVGAGAASYPDVDESNNIEAIEVLQAVKVMEGDSAGNFDPDRPVSRAEMAVIMALLLNLDYDYYRGTKTFNDVPNWCAPYVAACYANGIISGYNATTYGSADTVNAVQAASMVMRALGYFKFSSDYEGDFVLSTVKQASKIELFKGINANSMDPLTRNQVAQLALNALKTPIVEPDDNTITIKDANGNIIATGGQVNYVVTASSQAYARAIDDAESKGTALNGVQGYIIELGEKLYSGDLKLIDDRTDVFGRPSRQWEYDGKVVGTYAKTELLKAEYTEEVTGRQLYDLLGSDVISSIKKGGSKEYSLTVTIDGIDDAKINGKLFDETAMNKNNKSGVGDTGNGALTQVFVDGDKKTVDIAIINTYLARARADYSEKKDEVSFNVYGIAKDKEDNFVKVVDTRDSQANNNDNRETMAVTGEDFVIDGVKENDAYLVTVAESAIQSLIRADMVEDTTLTSFKRNSNVVADGTTYKYASTAEYDFEVLDQYTTSGGSINLKDKSYNLYLDRYGYMIGIDLVTVDDNYVFISGIEGNESDLGATNRDANAIFLDGTMERITFNVSKSSSSLKPNSLANTWCTYTKDSKDIYTLKEVAAKIDTDNGVKVAQNQDITSVYIDVKHVSLKANGADFARAYGNDNTVYLTAEVKTINAKTAKAMHAVISDVTNVTTGVKNASLEIWNDGAPTPAVKKAAAMAEGDKNANVKVGTAKDGAYGTYLLYKSNGYIIGAVAVADDSAASKNLVYVTSDNVDEESYDTTADEWTWSREVAINGEKGAIREVSDSLTYIGLDNMKQYNWYEVKYNAKGEVVGATLAKSALSGNEYVDDIKNVETAINDKDTVLFENSEYNKVTPAITSTALVDQPEGPHMKGSTFFVAKTDKEGFHVDAEVKIVFTQKNDNKTTTTYDDGASRLETYCGELNAIDGEYNYEVSAILEGGSAKVVVIRDLNGTGDSGNTPKPPQTETGDIYVDLRDKTQVLINTTKATLDDDAAAEAMVKAVEDAGFTVENAEFINDANDANDGKLVVTAKKGSIKSSFIWDPAGNDKGVNGVKFTIDGVSKITNATSTGDVDEEIAWGASASGDKYLRYTKDGGKTWTYGLENVDNVDIDTEGMQIETGYLKVTVNGAAVTNELDLKKSGIVSDASGATYALATATAEKGSAATGTGMKVGTNDYMPFGSTFADIHAKDGTTAGVCTIVDVDSVKVTLVNDSVDGAVTDVAKDVVAAKYDTAAALAGLSTTEGTHIKVGSETTFRAYNDATVKLTADTTVHYGYVQTGKAVPGTLPATVTVTWSDDLDNATTRPILPVGTKVTAAVAFNAYVGAAAADKTLKASACATGGYSCSATTIGTWATDTLTIGTVASVTETVTITFTLGNTTATATPTLTLAA